MLKSSYFSPKDKPETAMSLDTIGQKLKSAREAQGLSLVQVHERTKIPLHHLEAIDVGDGEELPERVYISGFIKRYAECVGLDAQVLGDEYKRTLEGSNGKGNGKSHAAPTYTAGDYVAKGSKIKVSTPSFKLWAFNLLIIIFLVGGLAWLVQQQSALVNQPDPSLLSLKESTNRLAPVNLPATAGQPAANNSQLESKSRRISLAATKHVWVEVKKLSSGENVFNGYLEQGDRRDFEDTQGIWVRAGNGGSLSVDSQGKIEPFGLEGKVTDRSFSVPGAVSTESEKPAAGSVTASSAASTAARPLRRPSVRRQSSEDGGSRVRRSVDNGGYRSIGGGDGGTRSIDVPYRYTEGRLDVD